MRWYHATVHTAGRIRANRLVDSRNGVRVNAKDQHAVTALLGARVLVPGRGRWLSVDGWPPRDHVLMLFISSTAGRAFYVTLREVSGDGPAH